MIHIPGADKLISNDSYDLDFSLSVINLCTRKPLPDQGKHLPTTSGIGICLPLIYSLTVMQTTVLSNFVPYTT